MTLSSRAYVESLQKPVEVTRKSAVSGPGSQRCKVLYDTLEMLPPPVDVPWSQRELDKSSAASPEARHRCSKQSARVSAGLPSGGEYRVSTTT